MAKIAQVSAKYIIHSSINIDGIVDRPDVIGAIFGQTEGLLGADLELRELQKSGRIGRIEVDVDTKGGKTQGNIIIPSSLDKAETAIVGAALEIIQRIGPCNAKIHVENIEDIRVSKRQFVIDRAKDLLRNLMDSSIPDSQELADEVAYSVRVMEIQEYGKGKLPCGPMIDEADEILVVEGRADVINLLKHGFKNSIAIGGTGVPQTLIDLSKEKTVTAFVDGDRGGDLIIQELLEVAEIDFVTKAPDGKEVEEITKKEIHKALRTRISAEQAKMELQSAKSDTLRKPMMHSSNGARRPQQQDRSSDRQPNGNGNKRPQPTGGVRQEEVKISKEVKDQLKNQLEELFGTRAAMLLDNNMSVLGKVPSTELVSTVKSLSGNVFAIILDGTISKDVVKIAEVAQVKIIAGMDKKAESKDVALFVYDAL
ncbi:MAG: DNA primase [Candidatus Woesearchaeota archaeon]|nr:MAG: DNA primase [Candidatus Woesearchaeota archaeon]